MKKTLVVTTKIGCINQCTYCPQEKLVKSYLNRSNIVEMHFDLFKKCIDKLPKDVAFINFSGFSEAWLNPECTRMIQYAHKKGFRINVFTTAIGLKLKEIDNIKKIPFNKFDLHLPDNKGLTKIKVDNQYLNVIHKIIKSNIKNIVYTFKKDHPSINIHPEIKSLLDKYNIKYFESGLTTRAGNIKIRDKTRIKKIKGQLPRCHLFDCNMLLPNGDVALCPMDWSLKHILGNLIDSDYASLFKGKEFSKIEKGLKDEALDILCRYCDIANPTAFTRIKKYMGKVKSALIPAYNKKAIRQSYKK